jgi:DNA processing protein
MTLSEQQRLAWLRLIRTENIGPVTFRELINRFGGAIEALRALPELSRRGGRLENLRICSEQDAAAELERAVRIGATLTAVGEAGYPPWLAHAPAAPPLLYVKGARPLAAQPIVAIVGARNGSAAGHRIASDIATGLGAAGIVVASGLARGIDGAAHRAALDAGTIAVVAGGLDVIYPPEHADLQAAIGERGLLVSERPPGLEPRAQDFPRRNRIIAGVAVAVVVVEAARRSGSLITARLAAELGREVLAVPGNPLDPRAEGTNGLIKNGATLVASAADVIESVGHVLDRPPADPSIMMGEPEDERDEVAWETPAEAQRARLIEALGVAPISLDEIARATAIPIAAVRAGVLELDIAGRVFRHPGNLVSLALEADSAQASWPH